VASASASVRRSGFGRRFVTVNEIRGEGGAAV
jgi:hypothetical protein